MKRNYLVLCLIASLLLSMLTGCQPKVVEKVGVLPDRTTQLAVHQTDEAAELEGKSWDVQNIDDLLLTSADMRISDNPSTYYYNGTAYLHRIVSENTADSHSLEVIQADGTLDVKHSVSLPADTACYYSPDGTVLVYEAWLEGCLTLILRNLNTLEDRIIWQSEEASLLSELGMEAHLICQWSPDGSSLLFMPICYSSEDAAEIILPTEESVPADDSTVMDESSSSEESMVAAESDNSSQIVEATDDADTSTQDDSAVANSTLAESAADIEPDFTTWTDAEKMQLVYETLPSFPLIYIYQRQDSSMQSFLIAAEDYALYEPAAAPMICASADGNRFFIYFDSPWDRALAHYVDVSNTIHYSTPLTDYLPSFTFLGSDPVFYEDLLYLHVDSVGIIVLDPAQGSLIITYPFNDPIHSFTIYEDTLIVAQPSSTGIGVDVTAYLLNLETKLSVLLYHTDVYDPYINYMEMSQDGMHLLIEQLSSNYQKRLIQLSFK